MIEHKLRDAYKLATFFERNSAARRLLRRVSQVFTEMVSAENFDPRTVRFNGYSPCGEPDKVIFVLESAEYSNGEPWRDVPENKYSGSYQLLRVFRSFYASFLADNPRLRGYVESCPGLTDCLMMLVSYVVDRMSTRRKPLESFELICGDTKTGDLTIQVYIL